MVMQVSCRDRNRIAIQGDVLGAAAMGVTNILCLTGDGVQAGDQPDAKPVFDLDCISLLQTVTVMRDQGEFLSGRELTTATEGISRCRGKPLWSTAGLPPGTTGKKDQCWRTVCPDTVLFRS